MSCSDRLPPVPLSYVSMTTSIFLSILTIFGNLLVCLAVLRDPKKEIRTPFTLLILNLSAADLIVGSIADSLSVVYHYMEAKRDVTFFQLVVANHIAYYISSTASLLSLAGLTLDRYIALTSPQWYQTKVSFKTAAFVSTAIWVISLSMPWLYLHYGFIRYALIFANTSILVTIVILVLAYIGIIKKLRKQVFNLEILRAHNTGARARQRATLWEKKLTTTYLVMLVVFLVFLIPSIIIIYILNFCITCSCVSYHVLRDVHFLLILSSSAFNPILYGWRLANFRRAFWSIVRCDEGVRVNACAHAPQEDVLRIELEKATVSRSKVTRNQIEVYDID